MYTLIWSSHNIDVNGLPLVVRPRGSQACVGGEEKGKPEQDGGKTND